MRPYQHIIAWQEAHKLTLKIYEVSKVFPTEERFGLSSQIRRAAVSVCLNIAEGNSKKSRLEKSRFFEISHASLNEVHCAALLAYDLHYLDKVLFDEVDDHIQRTSFLLSKLRKAIA